MTLTKHNKTLIRLPQVKQKTGLSRSTIYLKMKLEEFPQSIPLGARSIAWLENEVEEWINTRIDTSRKLQGGSHA